ncbi:MAG: hypothetical protein MJ175_08555, partial [Clostridia bacterium]|nr:hypothetical protein [Clostridia bacterium]
MMENTKVYTQQLNIRHRKQRIRYRVLTFLAAVVVFITTYAMIIPAITWERTLLCEIPEHTHGEACWQDETLICGMEEHVHDTAGFDAPPRLHDDYLCGMSEHAHTEDCYFEDGTLRCTLIEHIHDDTCTAETKDNEKLLMGEASADAMAPDGLLPEAPAAALLNAGAEPGEPDDSTAPEDPPVPEDPLGMDEYITSVTIQRRENANEEWVPVDQYVHENDQLRIQLYYELPAETLSDNNYKVSYQIDPSIKVLHETSGTVPGPDGKPAGKYTVTEDGVVTIVFDHEYVEMNQNGSKLDGFVTFYSTVESMGGKEDEELVFPFKEVVTVTVKNPEGDLSVEKASKNVKPTEGTLDYEIVVSSENGTYAPVILKDTLTNADVIGEITIVTPEGENVSYEGTFPDIILPALEKGGQYIITYSAALDSEHKLPQVQTITNKVTVESKNSLDEPLYDDDEQTDSFSRPSITKQGIYNSASGTIDWTITINSSSSTRHDLSGWTLSDDFEGNVLDPNLDIVIKPNPLTGKDSIKTHLPYVFPQDSAVTYYSVTYRTNGNPDSKNQAMLTPPSGEGITTGPVGTYSFEIFKSPLGIYADHNNEAGDIIVRQEWLLTVDTTNGAVFANIVSPFADISPANHPEAFPNGGYWSMSDTLNNGQPTYITEELQRENARRIAEEIKNSGYEGSFYIFTGQGNNASINDTLIYRTEEGSDAWDFMADNPITEGTLHLYIIFDTNYGPGKIMELHYSNYMNVQDGTVTGIYGSNFIYVKDANSAINTGVSQWYSPVVLKFDSRNRNGGQITEHRLEEVIFKQGDHEAYTPTWDLRIHLPLQEYTEPVMIKEVLPEGTKFYTLGKTNFSTYISLNCSETIDGVSHYLFHSGWLLALDGADQTSKPNGTEAYSSGKEGHGYVTNNGYRIDYFYNPELTEIS